MANKHIRIDNNSYEKMNTFKYLGCLFTIQNYIREEIKFRLKTGNSCIQFSINRFVVSTSLEEYEN